MNKDELLTQIKANLAGVQLPERYTLNVALGEEDGWLWAIIKKPGALHGMVRVAELKFAPPFRYRGETAYTVDDAYAASGRIKKLVEAMEL